jgi:Tol biopolymer transport system component
VVGAAISPDGRYLSYCTFNGFLEGSLWIRQLATGSTVQLRGPERREFAPLAFSPDGSFVYYMTGGGHAQGGEALYQIPSLGGVPRLLATGLVSQAAVSADGKKIAYVGTLEGEEKPALIVAGLGEQGPAPRAILRNVAPAAMQHPAWSPDGETLAFVASQPDPSGLYAAVTTLRVGSGSAQQLGSTRWRGATGGLAWVPDGSGLLLNAREQTGQLAQVWFVSYPRGAARPVTNDLFDHQYSLSVAGNGKSFVVVQTDQVMNLWIAPKGEEKRARQITSGRSDGGRGLAWTTDGKLIYASDATGSWQLWVTDAEGGAPRQLTTDSRYHVWPTACAGTGRVFFSSDASGPFQLWGLGLDEGQMRADADGEEQQFFDPDCSPDGSWLAGLSAAIGAPVDIFSAGKPVRRERESRQMRVLYDGPGYAPKISPDGKRVAFLMAAGGPSGSTLRIGVVSAAGGGLEKSFDAASAIEVIPMVKWTPDGRAVAYLQLRSNAVNLWAQPLDGGKPKQITHFADGIIYNFAWSRDGKQLALARGTYSSDAVLFSAAR